MATIALERPSGQLPSDDTKPQPTASAGRRSDVAIAFLQQVGPRDRHNLFAIIPDGPVEGRTFEPGAWPEMADWIDARHDTANLYFSINEPRLGAPHDKLKKTDIGAIRIISVDQDTKLGAPEECATIRSTLTRAVKEEGLPQPSIVVDTGNGLQCHWLLEEKVTADRMTTWAEGQARAFAAKVDGDSTHNVDRILRLPGTFNLPKAKKRALGRTVRPTKILSQVPVRYKPTELSSAVAPLTHTDRDDSDLEGLDARIFEIREEIAGSGWDTAHAFDDLESATRVKLDAAKEADPTLVDLLAGKLPDDADDSGSGYRLLLATRLGRLGTFDAVEFASICHAWQFAHGANALTPRSLARDWVRFGEAQARLIAEHVEEVVDEVGFADPTSAPAGMATVLDLVDPQSLPVREWLVAPRLPIGDVSQLVGEPGVSKSSLALRDALAVATGEERLLRGEPPVAPDRLHRTGPVIIYNAEDRLVEMKRRLRAAQLHFGISHLKHPIHLWSGVDGEQIVLLKRNGTTAHSPLGLGRGVDLIRAAVRETDAVLLVLDPQVGLSGGVVPENDTDGMDFMLALLAKEANNLGISILTCHHTSKSTRNDAGDMGAGRGAFSVAGKLRAMTTLMNVSDEDAKAWGYPPGDLVRLDYAKSSHAQKPKVPTVLRRLSVLVGNGTDKMSTSAGQVFEGSPEQQLRLVGDHAPVLEVIGLGVPRGGAALPMQDAEHAKRVAVATAVLTAIHGEVEVNIAAVWEEIGAELVKAGVTKSRIRHVITSTVKLALAGDGLVVEHLGQLVCLRAVRDGSGEKAPWKIVTSAVSAAQPMSTDARDASAGVFA